MRRVVWRAREAANGVRFAYQRVVRGWDDRAVWSVDYHLTTRTLGQQLVWMADSTVSYPSGDQWTHEGWTSELRRRGEALIAYSDDDTLNHDKDYPPAREALLWVADHLRNLWD